MSCVVFFFLWVRTFILATKGRAPWSKTQTLRLTNSYRLQYNHRTYSNSSYNNNNTHYQIHSSVDLSIWATRYQLNPQRMGEWRIMYLKSTINTEMLFYVCWFRCFLLQCISIGWSLFFGFLWACYGYRKDIDFVFSSLFIEILKWQFERERKKNRRENFCGCFEWASKCHLDDFLFEFSSFFVGGVCVCVSICCELAFALCSGRVSLSLFDDSSAHLGWKEVVSMDLDWRESTSYRSFWINFDCCCRFCQWFKPYSFVLQRTQLLRLFCR